MPEHYYHKDMATNPRKTALTILNILDKGRKNLDEILEDVFSDTKIADKRDRGLIYALVYGVLRRRGFLDRIIGHYSKIRLNKIDPSILNIIRLGLFQIIYLTRIPVSAAVNTSVDLAKQSAQPWVAGFVNAVLRNADRGYKNISLTDSAKDPVAAIAVEKSFPSWLIKRWITRFGQKETENLCDEINKIPAITIRVNSIKTTRKKLKESIKQSVRKISCTGYSGYGISFFNPDRSIPELPGFKEGWFQVQDEAAQLVSMLLNPQPHETVLDACAGLGGKTGHIAQLMENKGKIIAVDRDKKKLLKLEIEMKRLGVTLVKTLSLDLENKDHIKKFPLFDRILLDAPCSGMGVIRRNPDTKWSAKRKKIEYLKDRQVALLENMAELVKPSGKIVYAVCSTEPEENEEVVNFFLDKHPEFVIAKGSFDFDDKLLPLIDKNGFFKTFPHLNKMDGFFAVSLKRKK